MDDGEGKQRARGSPRQLQRPKREQGALNHGEHWSGRKWCEDAQLRDRWNGWREPGADRFPQGHDKRGSSIPNTRAKRAQEGVGGAGQGGEEDDGAGQ